MPQRLGKQLVGFWRDHAAINTPLCLPGYKKLSRYCTPGSGEEICFDTVGKPVTLPRMVKRLLHTRYRVSDLEKTVDFYKNVLGLEETRRSQSGRGSQLVFFKAPGSDEEIEICKYDASAPCRSAPT